MIRINVKISDELTAAYLQNKRIRMDLEALEQQSGAKEAQKKADELTKINEKISKELSAAKLQNERMRAGLQSGAKEAQTKADELIKQPSANEGDKRGSGKPTRPKRRTDLNSRNQYIDLYPRRRQLSVQLSADSMASISSRGSLSLGHQSSSE